MTSFDLGYVFVHVFAIAPSLILMLVIALLGTRLLPRVFIYTVLAPGSAMEIVGFASLFSTIAVTVFIALLIVQTFWYAATGIMLIIRTGKASDTAVQKGRELLVQVSQCDLPPGLEEEKGKSTKTLPPFHAGQW